MSRPRNPLPTYRRHSSGQAVCTVRVANGSRKDFLLGDYGTSASKSEYHRICGLVESNDGVFPSSAADITVGEAILAYVRHATDYYGSNSAGLGNVKRSLKTCRELYGLTSATDFGPKALKMVQEKWTAEGITRKSINKMTGTVKRAFRWMVSEELLPAECYHRLQSVEGLRLGRTTAPDNPPVRPADVDDLEKALAFMPPMVAAVCRLQTLSAARCGELLKMTAADIDRTGPVWSFTPTIHKGTWKGKGRAIYFGAEAQAVLAPFIRDAGDGYLFSAARGEVERQAERSANRVTPRYPSHMARNDRLRAEAKPDRRQVRETYTTSTVRRAIERACDAAGVERFTPHRLRHLAALTIRTKFGTEHARAMLGHTIASMTEHYSRDVDKRLASEVVAKIG